MEQKNEQAQRLNSIKERENKTRDSIIRMKANLENIQAELRKVSAQTKDLYGTDDVAKLRDQFVADNKENEEGLSTFDQVVTLREQLVDTIETNTAKLRLA